MIYLDHASTTKPCQQVLDTYKQVLDKYYINSESIYPSGVAVNELMEKSRSQIADLLSVKSHEVIFTSGGSEANNLAIKGTALKRSHLGKHIITTAVEHSSVINSCKWLEQYFSFEVTYLPVDEKGCINIDDLKNALRDDTILVSIMYINNESGAIMDIDAVKKNVRSYRNAYLHVDCVQALGKIAIDLQDIDLASFSAHKINGLKGSGFLVKKQHVQLAEVISGGQQEFHLRGGTANACSNIVLAKTLRLALENLPEKQQKCQKLHDYLYQQLSNCDKVVINSSFEGSANIINFSCLTVTSQVMMNALYNKGFEVSAQSTCDSNDAYSRVIAQMTKNKDILKSTIRVSICYENTIDELDQFINALKECIQQYG